MKFQIYSRIELIEAVEKAQKLEEEAVIKYREIEREYRLLEKERDRLAALIADLLEQRNSAVSCLQRDENSLY